LADDSPPQEVLSPVNGEVIFAGLYEGFGYSLRIDAGNGFVVMLSHFRLEPTVSGRVQQGQVVGIMGGSGRGGVKRFHDHIHLQLFHNGACKSSYPMSKPEPMSGNVNFVPGSYVSDNVRKPHEGIFPDSDPA
jgi:murein DD-endopeptidase MepM/ murein hydrolase activator NlpD